MWAWMAAAGGHEQAGRLRDITAPARRSGAEFAMRAEAERRMALIEAARRQREAGPAADDQR